MPSSEATRYAPVGTASVVDALASHDTGGIIEGLPLIVGSGVFIGPAVTLRLATEGRPEDGRLIWDAIDTAPPGSVLVASTGGVEISTLGGVTAGTAVARQLAGGVTDGLIRDVDEIRSYGFPVHCRRAHPRAIRGFCSGVGIPVRFGDVEVARGDLIVADGDGVVCVPQGLVPAVMKRAYEIERLERLWVDHARAFRSIARGYDTVSEQFGSPH